MPRIPFGDPGPEPPEHAVNVTVEEHGGAGGLRPQRIAAPPAPPRRRFDSSPKAGRRRSMLSGKRIAARGSSPSEIANPLKGVAGSPARMARRNVSVHHKQLKHSPVRPMYPVLSRICSRPPPAISCTAPLVPGPDA